MPADRTEIAVAASGSVIAVMVAVQAPAYIPALTLGLAAGRRHESSSNATGVGVPQYVVRHRTLADLAREKGMSTANTARRAHAHNIPLRPRAGGRSHDTVLRMSEQTDEIPALLREALTSPYAWQRLERFMAALPSSHDRRSRPSSQHYAVRLDDPDHSR
ncbi:hypothetical protein [Streptomyces atratus]|uniref:hypothetical protein n=1 Tax=Streptomyces atratus TaxID=1893 RepID=UPI002256F44B|nr:hypothetical protein [Streptomyces atratus]MCX5345981.1 FAD-dependent oxidoreductase [Streptomyces atratus]